MKDAYYFPHFSNARNDRRIKRLRMQLGLEGYAIFFMILETLRDEEGFKYPISDIDLLADEFGTSLQKVEAVIKGYDLFIIDGDYFYSEKLIEYLQPYLVRKDKAKKAAKKRWGSNAQAMLKHYSSNTQVISEQCSSNAQTIQIKEKEIKGNESKQNEGESEPASAPAFYEIDSSMNENYPPMRQKTNHIASGILSNDASDYVRAWINYFFEYLAEKGKYPTIYTQQTLVAKFKEIGYKRMVAGITYTVEKNYNSFIEPDKQKKQTEDKINYDELEMPPTRPLTPEERALMPY